jgi:tetratricopeptide (TPR) repeat protein
MKKIFSMIMYVTMCGAAFFSCATTTGGADGHIPKESITQTGNYNEAVVSDINSDGSMEYLSQAYVYYRSEDYDRAIAEYDNALHINPNFVEAYTGRGNAYYRSGNYDQAIEDYNEALRINPDFVEAYNNRGNAKRSKGDYDEAIAD